MDEERRTIAQSGEHASARHVRVAFINTGFLDRTGDEIHTSMEAGPMVRKADMKTHAWINAYEDRNVDIGLAAGLPGQAQIGKGMWAAPDVMAEMLEEKIGHPQRGRQHARGCRPRPRPRCTPRTTTESTSARRAERAAGPPPGHSTTCSRSRRRRQVVTPRQREEVDNNGQGILGYVVRWIDRASGCSKVPDIHDVALMEDRATLRISSQLLANWLRHGVVTRPSRSMRALRRMAASSTARTQGDPDYRPWRRTSTTASRSKRRRN